MKQRAVPLHDDLPIEEDLPDLIAEIVLGENIERMLTDPTSPVAHMLERARGEFLEATISLLDADAVDMSTAEGLKTARSLQAKAHRYLTMCRWISEANMRANEAEEQLDITSEEESAAIEHLKEQMNGTRAKPAHDA